VVSEEVVVTEAATEAVPHIPRSSSRVMEAVDSAVEAEEATEAAITEVAAAVVSEEDSEVATVAAAAAIMAVTINHSCQKYLEVCHL
jgi:hypothetical protein